MTAAGIRDFVISLGIAGPENCYAFKMDNKKQCCIGCYPLKRNGAMHIPIGGMENASYGVFPASFLVHWTKESAESEKAAHALFDALAGTRGGEASGMAIKFIQPLMPEPVYVGTDSCGVHEWVIEALVYYERKRENGENKLGGIPGI